VYERLRRLGRPPRSQPGGEGPVPGRAPPVTNPARGARRGFDGLEYFPPDPDYRVEATATVHDDPEAVDLETTDERTVRYLRVVTFSFAIDGDSYELNGYRREGEESAALFVPFRDKTTGQQTYHAGRYMELETAGIPRRRRRGNAGLQSRLHALLCVQRELLLSAPARGELAGDHDSRRRADAVGLAHGRD